MEILPIVYTNNYNVPLFRVAKYNGSVIRLDKCKQIYDTVMKFLKCNVIIPKIHITIQDLQIIYPKEYISKVFNRTWLINTMKQSGLEVPIISSVNKFVIQPILWQITGTMVACDILDKYKWSINIGGGFTKGFINKNDGLYFFNDVLLAAYNKLSNGYKVLIIDFSKNHSLNYISINNSVFSEFLDKILIIDIVPEIIKKESNYYRQLLYTNNRELINNLNTYTNKFEYDVVIYVTGGSSLSDDNNDINMTMNKDLTVFSYFYDNNKKISCIFNVEGDSTQSHIIIANSIINICNYVKLKNNTQQK